MSQQIQLVLCPYDQQKQFSLKIFVKVREGCLFKDIIYLRNGGSGRLVVINTDDLSLSLYNNISLLSQASWGRLEMKSIRNKDRRSIEEHKIEGRVRSRLRHVYCQSLSLSQKRLSDLPVHFASTRSLIKVYSQKIPCHPERMEALKMITTFTWSLSMGKLTWLIWLLRSGRRGIAQI